MPSANPIRKEILQALENHILPALWQEAPPLGYVTAALKFPPGINARLISKTVPRAGSEILDFPLQAHWPRAHLHSSFWPYFGFLYEGIADERTLVTAAQASRLHTAKGLYAIRWQAPSMLFFPPGVARSSGAPIYWEGSEPVPPMGILWFSLGAELLMHTHVYDITGQRRISHSLQINDKPVLSLAGLFMEELQSAPPDDQSTARAILLAMMLRLQKNLRAGHAKIANTSRSPVLLSGALPPGDQTGMVGRDAAIFIQMHLHEPLSLSRIAEKVNLSPAHLNRLFQHTHGVSVMRYVRKQRIAASQKILEEGNENVTEIAQLVGFKRANLFCRTFRQETGLSPGQFRRRAKREKKYSFSPK